MFDLNLITLNYSEGLEKGSLPGLYAAATPRRPARGRAGDLLVMLVSLQNSALFTAEELQTLLDQLAQAYYQIPGTVTTALRSVVEVLSQALLDRNLRNISAGRQGLTLLNLAAIHGNQLYLAHSGPTHTFVVSPRTLEHFTDPQLAGRGLGLSRTVSIRYYQAELEAGSSLIFCPEPPPAWNASLITSSALLPAEVLRRRLVGQARPNLSAAVIQVQGGSGKITLNGKPILPEAVRPVAPTGRAPAETPAPVIENKPQIGVTEASSSPQAAVEDGPVESKTPESIRPPISEPPSISPAAVPEGAQAVQAGRPASMVTVPPDTTPAPGAVLPPGGRRRPVHRPNRPVQEDEPVIQEMQRRRSGGFPWARLAPYWNGMRVARRSAGQFIHGVVTRLLPGGSEPGTALSPALLIFIASAVPLVIAAVGLVTYLNVGVNKQYEYNFGQAQLVASQAVAQKDPQAARNGWESALVWLDLADKLKVTSDSAALRQQAQNALDQLDGVVRPTFVPALVSDLPKEVNITRMLTVGNDLYLLDAAQGSVFRAVLTGQGYQVDSAFKCGPGPSGSLIISPLVDILAMPLNNFFNASIVAIDGAGNILYCLSTDGAPTAMNSGLAPPGDRWGKITAMGLDNSQLYVLDPRTNIGIYAMGSDGSLNNKPDLFFANVPAMGDVVDMTVTTQDLYLLHSDGHMTLCTFSPTGVEATRCTDPAPYADPRPGNEPNPTTFLNTHFSRIEYTDPPDPSIYVLDPNTATIYHFSLRLNLQRLLRPQPSNGFPLPSGAATAFYVSRNRVVFMAFGNQVLYAPLP